MSGFTVTSLGSTGAGTSGAPISGSSASSIANDIPLLQFLTSSISMSNNQFAPFQGDANGNLKGVEQYAPGYENNVLNVAQVAQMPLASPTAAWSSFTSPALSSSQVIKASPGNLKSFNVLIDVAAAKQNWYIQVVDNTSYNLTGGLLRASYKAILSASNDITYTVDFGDCGIYFGTGIAIGLSSTPYGITLGTNHLSIQHALYK